MAYNQNHQGGSSQQAQGDDIRSLEGSLRGLVMGSTPDIQTPPQKKSQVSGQPAGPTGKSPHKRLNQKERRQLAAQLTVPVNERASVSTLTTQSSTITPVGARYSHPATNPQSSTWRNSEPRMMQQQQQEVFHQQQQFRQRSMHAGPSTLPQYQNRFAQAPPPSSLFQGRPSSFDQQGPHQQWNQPQVDMPQNVRPPDRYQQQRQWQAPQQPHALRGAMGPAPAFHDVQFQDRRPPVPPTRQLYQPGGQRPPAAVAKPESIIPQCDFLESLLWAITPDVAPDESEIQAKRDFRVEVEKICREAITKYEHDIGNTKFQPESVDLMAFGSTASGFATKASDMDLALLTPLSNISGDSADSPIPRVMEKALLDHGYGARLLTRTRVPIIKLCEKPTPVLRAHLLKERLQWENGAKQMLEDEDSIEDDALDDGTPSPPEVAEMSAAATADPLSVRSVQEPAAPKNKYQEILQSLTQKQDKKVLSLGDYYGKAKNVLHLLEGRDAGVFGGQNILKQKEVDILEDVCMQFIHGLDDAKLREKLLGTKLVEAINLHECDQKTVRSLSSLYNVVEGEVMLAQWQLRPLEEKNETAEQTCEAHINSWNRFVLDSPSMKDCSAEFNKTVHQFLVRIKTMPSLQLVFLKQGSTESASNYYLRADAIRRGLGIDDNTADVPRSILITHYINGIYSPSSSKIRSTLEALRAQENLTLRKAATYHRMLELIRDYEKALDNKIYIGEDEVNVRTYVSLLRSATHTPSGNKLILPLTRDFQPVIRAIASLPDPADDVRQHDRFQSHLEFPKSGVGIQCDINFAADLALHNTQLLRCYCAADSRVKPMILFVKHWAKRRGINTPYRGTLSSYGYVLMVLHYLMNVADPFVIPNLQHVNHEPPEEYSEGRKAAWRVCEGRDIRFWRDEVTIMELARAGRLTNNGEKIGSLLRGFFEYYAQNGRMTHVPNHASFDWGRDVLSLRTLGGILSKHDKGWVGAKTVRVVIEEGAPPPALNPPALAPADKDMKSRRSKQKAKQKAALEAKGHAPEVKEIKHRYLFAIEDPFEIEHNIARTVTHTGICSIRDELRRAWGIIRNQRNYRPGGPLDMRLFDEVKEKEGEKGHDSLVQLMREIHGDEVVDKALA